MSKPSTAAGYPPELAIEARGMCLFIATILGDLLEDIVVVGGLVPYLIIDQEDEAIERHVGTRDLDLGMSLGVLDEEQYKQVRERLWGRGFRPGQNEKGNMTRQTCSVHESGWGSAPWRSNGSARIWMRSASPGGFSRASSLLPI